jgi:hypothetical protein
MENTTSTGDSARPFVLGPDDRLVRVAKLLIELEEYARQVSAARGATVDLRTKVREASRAGTIPRVSVGPNFAYRLSDVPVIARVVGIVPADGDASS